MKASHGAGILQVNVYTISNHCFCLGDAIDKFLKHTMRVEEMRPFALTFCDWVLPRQHCANHPFSCVAMFQTCSMGWCPSGGEACGRVQGATL